MFNLFKWGFKKSPWVYHLAASACNNCDIELLDALTPKHDIERFGMVLVGSPRHADIIIVSGIVNRQSIERFKRTYDQVPKPNLVVAIGACACSANMFRDSYNFVKPMDEIVPVDVYVPGCPPKPEAIIAGIVKALEKL
ncbi:MAG: NADH-quinone oxidoreductase subunit NuoB [Candidatus Margulisiibacteriota bacterium]